METITEDYVSFETARLLKEKGFPQDPCICNTAYTTRGKLSNNAKSFAYSTMLLNELGILSRTYSMAPTLQMVMKWLREKHNLFIQITVDFSDGAYPMYDVCVVNLARCTSIIVNGYNRYSYTQACETAIKYSLENLI